VPNYTLLYLLNEVLSVIPTTQLGIVIKNKVESNRYNFTCRAAKDFPPAPRAKGDSLVN